MFVCVYVTGRGVLLTQIEAYCSIQTRSVRRLCYRFVISIFVRTRARAHLRYIIIQKKKPFEADPGCRAPCVRNVCGFLCVNIEDS